MKDKVSEIKLITMESEDFYKLIEKTVAKIIRQSQVKLRWKSKEAIKKKYNIKSDSHIWRLMKSNKISYMKDPDHPRLVLFDDESFEKYFNKNTMKALY